MDLKGKKILFLAPKFFSYEIEIKKKMESLGAIVEYYDERMEPTNLEKIIIRINKNILNSKIEKYYKKIRENSKNKNYDYVFIITPETITRKILKNIKNDNQNAKFILYMWDSLDNKKNARQIFDKFDSIYSFDKDDCKKYKNIIFRPLFYLEDYLRLSQEIKENYKYEITFIGTAHSDRYKILKELKRQANIRGISYNFYMYFPSKILFYFKKIFDKSYRYVNEKDFNFNSLSKEKVLELLVDSKVIIDVQHPKQTGLTMRTIEMLGMKKKIITTNKDIKKYNFYNEYNVNILERDNPNLDEKFLKTKYSDIDKEIYYYYSIDKWLQDIFN